MSMIASHVMQPLRQRLGMPSRMWICDRQAQGDHPPPTVHTAAPSQPALAPMSRSAASCLTGWRWCRVVHLQRE